MRFPGKRHLGAPSAAFLAAVLALAGAGCSSDGQGGAGPEPECVVCPNPDCHVPHESFASCSYPASRDQNTGREAVVIGGSVVLGVACYREPGGAACGFVPGLERLTGLGVANFGQPYFTAAAAVGGLVPYARVDTSVRVNPDAVRAYVLLGGNDVIQYFVTHVDQAPRPGDGCRLKPAAVEEMEKTLGNVRRVVERYRLHHGVPEVVVGSQPPVGEASRACNSCRMWAERTCGDCSQCLNEVLGTWSDMAAGMVAELGGPAAGIFFADHFHGFPEDPGECELYCDCPHPNCIGQDLMAEIWYEATE